MSPTSYPFAPELRLLAAALAGDRTALEKAATTADLQDAIMNNRLAPSLAARAVELGVTGPHVQSWRDELRNSAVTRIMLSEKMRQLGEALAAADIPWAPLKGMGLNPGVYPQPEERPTSDLDILIYPSDLDKAIDQLLRTGWRSLMESDHEQRYLRDEGYNWKAKAEPRISLELHFRLWGPVPEGMGKRMLARSAPAPALGPNAQLLDLADSFIVAAVHVWQTPTPRYLMLWWDLHRMAEAADDKTLEAVIERSRSEDLDLFVAEAAQAAAQLWGHSFSVRTSNELSRALKYPERIAARMLSKRPPTQAALGIPVLARLCSGRASRSGWRAVYRRVWAHPGVVEMRTTKQRSWLRRRLSHALKSLRH